MSAVYENLGKAFLGKKMLKDANESFEKALELDPNNKEVIKALDSIKKHR